jgi:hypothetical protein
MDNRLKGGLMSWAYDISLACRALVAAVFAVSVISKVRSRTAWRSFRSWLTGMPLRPAHWSGAPAALAATEAAVVVLAVVPATATAGLALGSLLGLILTVGLFTAVRRGSHEPCLCFGSSADPLSRRDVARNTLLLAGALAGLVSTAALHSEPVQPAGVALAAIAGLTAALLIIFSGDIVALAMEAP